MTARRVGKPTTLPAAWLPLVEAAGGVGALATALGISARSIVRYGAGEAAPILAVRRAIDTWAKRRGIDSPFRQ